MNPVRIVHFLFLAVLLAGCGQGTQERAGQNQAAAGPETAPPASETPAARPVAGAAPAPGSPPAPAPEIGAHLLMEKHIVQDKELGMDASSFLIPKGWKVEEKLYWFTQDNIVPVRYEGTFSSPDGLCQIQYLPRAVSAYYYDAMKNEMVGFEPSRDAEACLTDLVLPYNRKQFDYRIVNMKPFQVESIPRQGAYEPRASGATATIEYDLNGQPVQEEFTITLFTLTSEVPSMDMQGNMMNRPNGMMTVDKAFAVRAPKGRLEETRKLAMASIGSQRMELPWYNQLMQVSQMLQKQFYDNLAAQARISRIRSETNRQISQSTASSWKQQQESQDRQHHNFINYIRDVDDYKAPGSSEAVSLPSGYSNVYTNGNEYILTNTQYDPTRDPNLNTTWNKMEQANP